MSLSPGQKTHIMSCADDPVAIWTKLESVHEAKEPSTRFNAYDDLFSIRKDSDESLPALIMRSEQAVQLIKNRRPSGFTIDDLDAELQCMALIRALPDEYATFSYTIMIAGQLKKADLIAAFHTEEVQRQRKGTNDAANLVKANAVSAKKPTKIWFCTFHKKEVGHSSDRCYQNPAFTGTRPPWWKADAPTLSKPMSQQRRHLPCPNLPTHQWQVTLYHPPRLSTLISGMQTQEPLLI